MRQRGVKRVTRSPGQIAAAQDNVRDSPNARQKRPTAHRDMKLDETDKPAVYKKNLCRGSAANLPMSEVPESPFYTKVG